MNILPNPGISSIAGTQQAAVKGGESDHQASDASRRQSVAENPGGKPTDVAGIDPGSQTDDRGGNGREFYDRFERSEGDPSQEELENRSPSGRTVEGPTAPSLSADDGHIDFQA